LKAAAGIAAGDEMFLSALVYDHLGFAVGAQCSLGQHLSHTNFQPINL
jgi:hypothetical protein